MPGTVAGKLVAAFAMLTGLLLISAIISIVGSEMNDLRRGEAMHLPAEIGGSRARTQPTDTTASRQPAMDLAAAHDAAGSAPLSAPQGAAGDELHTQVELLRAMLGRSRPGLPASEAACLQVLQHTALSALDAYVGVLTTAVPE